MATRAPFAPSPIRQAGPRPAVAVAPDGLPIVAWMWRPTGAEPGETELKVTRCDDRTCQSGTTATVVKALAGWGSGDVAVAVDPDGNPVVVFTDEQTDPATVVLGRCSDPGCTDGALSIQRSGRLRRDRLRRRDLGVWSSGSEQRRGRTQRRIRIVAAGVLARGEYLALRVQVGDQSAEWQDFEPRF